MGKRDATLGEWAALNAGIFLDDLRQSEEMTVERFGARPWTHRVAEHTANPVRRVL
jgi:hypothetical protein